jgi:hypothetical protein
VCRLEAVFNFALNPLHLYYFWTIHIAKYRFILFFAFFQVICTILTLRICLREHVGDFTTTLYAALPFTYALMLSELKKGEACSVTLFLVSGVVMSGQTMMSEQCHDVLHSCP